MKLFSTSSGPAGPHGYKRSCEVQVCGAVPSSSMARP